MHGKETVVELECLHLAKVLLSLVTLTIAVAQFCPWKSQGHILLDVE